MLVRAKAGKALEMLSFVAFNKSVTFSATLLTYCKFDLSEKIQNVNLDWCSLVLICLYSKVYDYLDRVTSYTELLRENQLSDIDCSGVNKIWRIVNPRLLYQNCKNCLDDCWWGNQDNNDMKMVEFFLKFNKYRVSEISLEQFCIIAFNLMN